MHALRKKAVGALLPLLVLALLCLLPGLSASASVSDYPDIEGHWAQDELLYALENGYLSGFADHTVRPNEPITGAQCVSIFCRVFGALDDSAQAAPGESWYTPAQRKTEVMGIIPANYDLTAPQTRGQVVAMVSKAFQCYDLFDDLSVLDPYPETQDLSDTERLQLAGMVRRGWLTGYDGSLHLDETITRAQFCTLLNRAMREGTINHTGQVTDFQGDTLYIGYDTDSVSLHQVSAERVVVRSRNLYGLKLDASSIDTLVLANSSTACVDISGQNFVQVGPGWGDIELQGDCRELQIKAPYRKVMITGHIGTVRLGGEQCVLVNNGSIDMLCVQASGTSVQGSGRVGKAYVMDYISSLPETVEAVEDYYDYGLRDLQVAFDHPDTLPIGETLQVTATLSHLHKPVWATVSWLLDGQEQTEVYECIDNGASYTFTHDYTYTRDLNTQSSIGLRIRYLDDNNTESDADYTYIQQVDNYSYEYYYDLDYERIMSTVTERYTGNYTTKWAEEHDYSDYDKEFWVNAKGYASDTEYLVWINKGCQRVNIFSGSQGNWKLIRTCMVGTGAPGSATPSGVFKTTYKQDGWFTDSYSVYPVVRFYGGGYAFHSRLYYPGGSSYLKDASIGFPVSHGCVRMLDEDIQYMYDYIPKGTTVVSF